MSKIKYKATSPRVRIVNRSLAPRRERVTFTARNPDSPAGRRQTVTFLRPRRRR